ncbi:nitrogen regulatory protein P-II [Spirochaetia bacterium]|nr:nitrogen regulatory protein P-II [Spirochaetia bacterium]
MIDSKVPGIHIPILKCVIFILDWTKARVVTDICEKEHVRFHFIMKGRGTASSEILDLLGIGSTEKAVILCLEQDVGVSQLLKEVAKKMGLHNPGAGIAFTLPLSGINLPILQVFKKSIEKIFRISLDAEAEKMSSETKFDLIVSVVNRGYSDEFMARAREAGATGGTVINARGIMHQGPVKFFGISVQDEKEIITILSTREKKAPIMQAVSQAFGISSKAGGIIFSLPVDGVAGLDLK